MWADDSIILEASCEPRGVGAMVSVLQLGLQRRNENMKLQRIPGHSVELKAFSSCFRLKSKPHSVVFGEVVYGKNVQPGPQSYSAKRRRGLVVCNTGSASKIGY
jgi:hypothetical protein